MDKKSFFNAFGLLNNQKYENWGKLNKPSFYWQAAVKVGIVLLLIDLFSGKLFDISHWENVLVEAHGMLLDIILFGVITAIFEEITERNNEIKRKAEEIEKERERVEAEKQREIEKAIQAKENEIARHQEEIDDFRNWGSEEAVNRIVGSIRRLNRLGITTVNIFEGKINNADFSDAILTGSKLSHCQMKNCIFDKIKMRDSQIEGTDFEGSHFFMADIQGSQVHGAKFEKCTFRTSLLGNSRMTHTDFCYADLGGSYLSYSNLRGADFRKSDIRGTRFGNCDIRGVKFKKAKISYATDFENCKVYSADWIEKMKEEELENFHCIEEQYYVDEVMQIDEDEPPLFQQYYLVKRKPDFTLDEEVEEKVYAEDDKTDDVPKA